ncbi:MAG: rod shape-determining protein RodA [candidate division WOR-3 bacterium]|jgi:rod shape determining protein RodA|nr:rod shape-determining protein RodA [candidate division WOR-3 bacterium]MCR4423086.1 rod shape-determining protein RodA [candidate division WOR-3 bacterium]MDH7518425.1 rod shape-determining protein RodA [bacterium]
MTNNRRRFDISLLALTLTLITIGLLAIYSAGGGRYLLRQLIFVPIGFFGIFLFFLLPRRILYGLTEPLYALTLLLLIAVLFLGTGPGARRWFQIGSFSLQPSEFAKITVTLMLAKYLSYKREIKPNFASLAGPILIMVIPLLLILLEPDLSTALCLVPPFAAMLYWQGLRPLHILLLFMPFLSFAAGFSLYLWIPFFVFLAVLVFLRMRFFRAIAALATGTVFGLLSPVVLSLLKDYQRTRLISFFAPWFDPHGMGWNAIQSQIAIGSGRLLGKGFLHGTQKRLGFLPNRHTDFIFSAIAEETGFIGSLLLLLVIGFLIRRILLIAYNSRDKNASLIAIGFAAILFYQAFVNIGMLLGLLPITGVTLPFISYGGSSLLTCCLMIGLVLNISAQPE